MSEYFDAADIALAVEDAEIEQDKPIAWLIPGSVTKWPELAKAKGKNAIPLYTAEQVRVAIEATKEKAANLAYAVCAETRHVTLGDKCAAAIRSMK